MNNPITAEPLAISGGPKVRTAPWPVRKLFDDQEKQAVMALFDRAIEQGPEVMLFNGPQETAYCEEFARFLGGGFADGVNSGTNAVYVALRALEIEPFSEVIVPPITDAGGVMPVALSNCIPVPADSAPGSYNVGPQQIEERITEHTRAIIVAHIAGLPVDMDPIMAIARKHNLKVIEDCAQAHGAVYKGRLLGSIGDVSAFSTMPGKHHATGGQGGVVFTKDQELYWRIRRYADRGKPFGLKGVTARTVASLNFNMDDLHATIGRVQLKKLPGIIEARRSFAQAIADGCRQLQSVRLIQELPDCQSAPWFLIFKLELNRINTDKETFVEALKAEGLPGFFASYLHMPVLDDWCRKRAVFGSSAYPWQSPLYQGDANKSYDLPNALAATACHFHMTFHENCGTQEVADTIAALQKVEQAFMFLSRTGANIHE